MFKRSILLIVILLILLSGCSKSSINPKPNEAAVNTNFQVVDLFIDRAYYKPGEAVKVTSKIENKMSNTQQVKITLSIRYLLNEIHSETQTINLKNGFTIVEFNYQPPTETPKGYGVEVKVEDEHGNVLTTDSTAFDVLNNWTQNPRYGFLTDFYPERNDVESTMSTLNRYHINGLQFYDWMYRHEQFLTNQDPYYDLWSPKPKSIKTVNALIDGAHKYNIAAMPYTAVYGASREYALQHPEMVLFKASGEMYDFGGDKMMIMDPRPGSPWTDHLMEQFKEILGQTRFDGIHIDQYGDPKVGYTKDHERYDLTPTLADFVNKTKTLTNIYSQKDAVVFNLVNNWPVEAIAPTNEDFVYIEVWPPHNWFADLHTLIVMSQKLGGGKPVVLACYIDPAFENTAILNDAIIFASGGGHIEIGENNGMLSEAYFPNYRVISDYLAMTLQDYYDFSVRYQNVTGPTTQDATTNYKDKISIPNISTSVSSLNDVVWPFVRESEITTAINLVNLLDIEQNEWTAEVPNKPRALHNFQMSVNVGSRKVANVWFATPDHPQADQHLTFTLESGTLRIEVPSLDFWSMVVIEWANN